MIALALLIAVVGAASEAVAMHTYRFNGWARYQMIYDADPKICEPVSRAYNHFLSESVEDLSHGHAPPVTSMANPVATLSTDFEISQGDRFAAYGFKLPTLLGGTPTEGVYSVDIFNDGTKLPVTILTSSGGHRAFTLITAFQPSADIPDLINEIATAQGLRMSQHPDAIMRVELGSWFNQSPYKQFPGYFLRHWPNIDQIMNAWFKNRRGNVPTLLDMWSTAQVFVGPEVVIAANAATDFRVLNGNETDVVVYRMHRSGPEDLCYFRLDHQGQATPAWGQK